MTPRLDVVCNSLSATLYIRVLEKSNIENLLYPKHARMIFTPKRGLPGEKTFSPTPARFLGGKLFSPKGGYAQ